MVQFHETKMGHIYYERTLPKLVREVGRLADALEESNRLRNTEDIKSIEQYLKESNLNDYDLDGVEITEEDIDNIRDEMAKGSSLKDATNTVLYRIRECLDEGLEDSEEEM